MSENPLDEAHAEDKKDGTYKDLEVWQKADKLAWQVYAATKDFPREEADGITAQLREAALQIPVSIAEAQPLRRAALPPIERALRSLSRVQYLLDFSSRLDYLKAPADKMLHELAHEVEVALETLCDERCPDVPSRTSRRTRCGEDER